jgi:hypothetical protein
MESNGKLHTADQIIRSVEECEQSDSEEMEMEIVDYSATRFELEQLVKSWAHRWFVEDEELWKIPNVDWDDMEDVIRATEGMGPTPLQVHIEGRFASISRIIGADAVSEIFRAVEAERERDRGAVARAVEVKRLHFFQADEFEEVRLMGQVRRLDGRFGQYILVRLPWDTLRRAIAALPTQAALPTHDQQANSNSWIHRLGDWLRHTPGQGLLWKSRALTLR